MVATDRRPMAWEYRLPSDSLRSSSEYMCIARRRCGRNSSHMARSVSEKPGIDLGRLMRKRKVPPSGVEMFAPRVWNTL
ncbi:hypothetical protein D9M73_257770 [compost metagenome]